MRNFYMLLVISILVLSGCSKIQPAITQYRVKSDLSVDSLSEGSSCRDKSLKVAQAFSPTPLMSLNMKYVYGGNKLFSYSQAQWVDSPNRAISSEILKLLRATNLFKSVQTFKSRSRSNFLLESNIEDYIQYFSKDQKNSYSKVVINFTLIDMRTNEVIAAKTLSAKVASETLDADGGVEALNRALDDVLSQSIIFFKGVCI